MFLHILSQVLPPKLRLYCCKDNKTVVIVDRDEVLCVHDSLEQKSDSWGTWQVVVGSDGPI